jgi:hypothetical protein
MKSELFKLALSVVSGNELADAKNVNMVPTAKIKKAKNRGFSYTERHRGQWFKPEYHLEEIQIAQDTDGYLFRSLAKKLNRFVTAGWEIVGKDPETLAYMKGRIAEQEQATRRPFNLLIEEIGSDLLRFSNCMLVKVRNSEASTGKRRANINGKMLDPVAGYFVLPFETLHFKTKSNGEIKKVRQRTPTGQEKEYSPDDIIHFYMHKKPGFAMGTPEAIPVLDDISLLRRIEENVEELIESNLFPLFHYSVGSDEFPERYGPDGVKETDVIKETIEYMPAGGIYISDHRHKISAIGSEGRSLRIEGYLTYFKNRVFAGLGVSGVDMGEGDTANRATAQTLSKGAVLDIEALQNRIKTFVEFYMFDELLREGPFDIASLTQEHKVEIKFGIIDKEERVKLENQVIQLWSNQLLDETEARKLLGYAPVEDQQRDSTYFKLYQEPLALVKALGMPAADIALAESTSSSITKEGVEEQKKSKEKNSQLPGRRANPAGTGNARASAEQSRPSNQFGTKAGPKLDKLDDEEIESIKNYGLDLIIKQMSDRINSESLTCTIDDNKNIIQSLYLDYRNQIDLIVDSIRKQIDTYKSHNINEATIIKVASWRLNDLDESIKSRIAKIN